MTGCCSCWREPQTKDAYRLSWASVILTFIAAFVGITLYRATSSTMCLVYGLENCLDFLSSAVVLWRFFVPTRTVDSGLEKELKRREKRASVLISIILVVMGIFIFSASVKDFRDGEEDTSAENWIIVLSFFALWMFACLSAFKFHYSSRLESACLYKDGICSLIGTVLSGALFTDTLLIRQDPTLWWIDPVVAMGSAAVASTIGLMAIVNAVKRDKLPIFTLSWWLRSQGDGTDEFSGRPLGPEDYLTKPSSQAPPTTSPNSGTAKGSNERMELEMQEITENDDAEDESNFV